MMSSSAIAPPAEFALSGTAYASTSSETLAMILDALDLASLEQEHARLKRSIQQLVQSNKEIEEFIEQEKQEWMEFKEHQGQQVHGISYQPDSEFVLAIEENKEVIAKYERICAELAKAIQKKRDVLETREAAVVDDEQVGEDDGVYL
ncbi:hypothetical protein FBU30_008913 [Linnemannia zychae]|nr:hypothetical protein FBU30_008913 [Linnemannia zychae]